MTLDVETVTSRLESLGYEVREADGASLTYCVDKVRNTIKNETNCNNVTEGLMHVAVDMACGEFLNAKLTFAPDDIEGFDLETAVKQITTGDTTTVFAINDGSMTDEQRLYAFVNYILTNGRNEFNSYRCVKW